VKYTKKGGKIVALREFELDLDLEKKMRKNPLEDFFAYLDTKLGKSSEEECKQLIREVRKKEK